jgi:hypothetical protein
MMKRSAPLTSSPAEITGWYFGAVLLAIEVVAVPTTHVDDDSVLLAS